MTRPALIESERIRSVLIAVLMTVCLVGSLALAHVLIVLNHDGHPLMTVFREGAGFKFRVPDQWQSIATRPTDELFDFIAAFRDPDGGRVLTVASLRGSNTRSHRQVLDEVERYLTAGGRRRVRVLRGAKVRGFREGVLVGRRYVRITVDEQEGMVSHLMGVVTIDGRHYWVVVLAEATETGGLARIGSRSAMVEEVCRSIRSLSWHAAGAEQIERAGWDPALAVAERIGARPLVDKAHTELDPIVLVADRGPPDLCLLRVATVPDTTDPDPTVAGGAVGLLQDEFSLAAGRPPKRGEVQHVQVAGHDAFVAVLHDDSARMSRELWYVALSGGRAALFEVLAEVGSVDRARSWIEPVVGSIGCRSPSPGEVEGAGSPRTVVAEARRRGLELASRIRQDFNEHMVPGRSYRLYQQDGRVIGFEIARVLPRVPARPLPIHGSSSIFLIGGGSEVRYEWYADQAISLMRIDEQRKVSNAGSAFFEVRRMELIDRRLSISRHRGPREEQELTSKPVAESWIPPIPGHHWPVDLLRPWRHKSVLVWLSRGLRTPSLCWLVVDENAVGEIILWIRPVMSFNTIVYRLDPSGQVKQVSRVLTEGRPLGGARLLSRLTRRDELLQFGPGIADLLRRFEEKSTSP